MGLEMPQETHLILSRIIVHYSAPEVDRIWGLYNTGIMENKMETTA